jgi:hypothetical protein
MPDENGAADLGLPRVDLSGLPEAMAAARVRARAGLRPSRALPEDVTAQAVFRDVPGVGRMVTFGIEEPRKYATPELQVRADEVHASQQEIAAKLRYLGHLSGSGPAQLPHADVLDVRLAVLLDMLFPPDTRRGQGQRLDYDQRVADRIMELLGPVEDAVYARCLSSGKQLAPEALRRLGSVAGLPVPSAEQEPEG